MQFKASFAKIVGTPQEGRDSWVYVEEGFFLSLELCGSNPTSEVQNTESPPLSIAVIGKEIIDSLVNSFHEMPVRNLTNIKDLANKVNPGDGISLSLVLGIQVGQVFYLVCRGAGRVTAKREDKFAVILSEDGSASGILRDKDVFLLSSSKFSEIVSFDEVKNVFDSLSVSELAESLTPLVHRAEDTSGVAALIIQFKEIADEWRGETEDKKETPQTAIQTNPSHFFNRFKKVLSYPSSILRRSGALYLRTPQSEEEKKKRIIFGVTAILAVLLIVSVVLGINKKITNDRKNRFNQTYELSTHQYEEAKALLGLNNTRAVTLLTDTKTSLEKLSKDWPQNSSEAQKINELLVQINDGLGEAGQVYKITPEVFLDLNLVKEGASGKNLGANSDNMVISDNKSSTLYQVSISQKSSQILAGGENLAGANLLGLSENEAYTLTNSGIAAVNLKSKTVSLKIKKDDEWGETKSLVIFSGNLYLLSDSKIWKYTDAAGEKKNYLVSESDLGNPTSMAIDGSVWVASAGKILKFTQGKEENFKIQGLDRELGSSLLIFNSDQTKNLYILDRVNSRIVILDKAGSYKSQYVFSGLGEVSDMTVSESVGKIFLLSGSKIYEVKLK